MRKLAGIYFALCFFNASYAMDADKNKAANSTVKLPPSHVLTERLCAIGLNHFIENTELIERVAEQNLTPSSIGTIVENCLDDYREHIPRMSAMMCLYKPRIIKTILQDYPQAIEQLKKEGILS